MKKKTTEEFIEEAKRIYGEQYDYSKVEYVNDSTKVCIICPKHGDFWKTPSNHLHKTHPQGCPYCVRERLSEAYRCDSKDIVERFKNKHNDKYDYSKVEYKGIDTKVCIICKYHGEFWQTPYIHLQGCGCPKCSANMQLTRNEYIQKATIRHNGKYDYSITEFTKTVDKIAIKCPFHGIFYQIAEHHLQGCGCPKCKSSHMETDIRNLLIENNIEFEEQKRFSWLGLQSLDFYLPKQRIAIECQGRQHFEPINFFGGEESLKAEYKRDKLKNDLCLDNGVKLIYYANYKYNFPYEVLTNKNKLLKSIIK